MAKQITFHSVASMPASPNAGGVYFNYGDKDAGSIFGNNVQVSGVIYKGADKFGLGIQDVRVITESYTDGLVAGDANSYITHITRDGTTGFLEAHAVKFPSFNPAASTVTSSSNGHVVSVSTLNGQVKAVSITAPAKFSVADIGNGISTSTSGSTTVTVSTENGKVTKVVVAAPTRFALSEIGSANKSSSNSGVFVSVSTVNGKVDTVKVAAANLTPTTLKIGDTPTASINGIQTTVRTSGAEDTKLVTEKAVRDVVSALGNVMEFKGVFTSDNATAISNPSTGDVILIGANAGSWRIDGDGVINSSSGTALTAGQEYVCIGSSSDTWRWELIGDQNAQATLLGNKAQVGTATATAFKGLRASVSLNSNADPTMAFFDGGIVTASTGITTDADKFVTASAVAGYVPAKITAAINALDSGLQSTNNGVWVSVNQTDGKIVGVSVTAPVPFTAADIGSSVLTSTSGSTTVTVSTLNGKVSKVVVAAPTRFAVSEIGDGSSESTSNGTTVKVSTHYGKVTAVTVTAPNTATNQTVVSTVNNVGVSVTGNIVNVSAIGFGAAAQKGVVTASTSFKTNNYSNSLPTASAVAAYADGVVAAAVSGLDATVSSNHDGMSLTVTETDGKLTSCAVGFYWLDASNNVIA